jgi:hypothetical protein
VSSRETLCGGEDVCMQMTETKQQYVVVGGGVAGVCCAEELCRLLSPDDATVVLVAATDVVKVTPTRRSLRRRCRLACPENPLSAQWPSRGLHRAWRTWCASRTTSNSSMVRLSDPLTSPISSLPHADPEKQFRRRWLLWLLL